MSIAIDGGKNGASPVTQDVSARIQNLTIDSDDSLAISNGVFLQINGSSINNAGTITLNSSTGAQQLTLTAPNTTLAGGGTVTLAGGQLFGQQLLTIQEPIQGAGVIMTVFNNQSVINANATNPLNIDLGAATTTNNGTLEASSGGLLQLNGGTFNNAGGKIQALDKSTARLGLVTINGGMLATTGSGVIQAFSNGPVLNGVTNSGTYQIPTSNTFLEGTITNTGTIQVNSTAAATSQLLMSGTVTLTGGGKVTLSDQPRNFVSGTLVNQNNTISGAGSMGGGTLTNGGVINATSANHNRLILFNASNLVINTGILEASSGGTLQIQNNVTNTGGVIYAVAGAGASAGGAVLLSSVTVSGGTLKTGGSGSTTGTMISTNSTFNGVANAGTLQVADNTNTFLEGTINNTGRIQALSTLGNALRTRGNVTLAGTGSVSMSKKTVIYGSAATDILTNQNTIFGAGNIGNDFMGLINKGTILANQTDPLDIETGSETFQNMGTLSVASGSVLDITGGPFANFSGTTLTGGTYLVTGTLQFDNAKIVTNAANITLNGLSSKIVDQSGRDSLATLASNAAAGNLTVANGHSLTTTSPFSNAGSLLIAKGSTFDVAGVNNYTQTGGKTTVDGTLTAAGTINVQGGSVFGNGGTLSATVDSSGAFSPGDAANRAGALAVSKDYVQSASGVLNIDIGGATPGTQFDELNVTGAAKLNGTLNLNLINSFVPPVGSSFVVLNCGTRTGTFSVVNGTKINASEHFTVVYNSNNVTIEVVSGP